MSGFSGFDIIDPDAIARDIVSGNTVHAAREALRRRHAALSTGRSYLVETTLAGSGILRHMAATRRAGYWMSCNSCPSVRLAKRSTVSATASRSAVTMSRKLTRGGGSYGRTPIFRRRLRDRMSSYYMTIPISTSRTGRLRSSGTGHGGSLRLFPTGRPRLSLTRGSRIRHDAEDSRL